MSRRINKSSDGKKFKFTVSNISLSEFNQSSLHMNLLMATVLFFLQYKPRTLPLVLGGEDKTTLLETITG